MILSDLLDSAVLDATGQRIGYVIDVRFIVDGSEQRAAGMGSHSAVGRARLDTFIVSPHARTSFLGYERSDVTAPVFIARYLRWRHRGSQLIEWHEVTKVTRGTLQLKPGYQSQPLAGHREP